MDLTLFTEEEFRKAFLKLDKDGSGYLEISEVHAAEGAPLLHVVRVRERAHCGHCAVTLSAAAVIACFRSFQHC